MTFLLNLLSDLAAELVLVAVLAVVSGLALRYRALARVVRGKQAHSPDGNRTAFESGGEIYVTDAAGLRNVTRHPAKDTGALWAPNSRWVAFTSDRDGAWQVYVADVTTGRLARLAQAPGPDRPIAWTGAGNLVIWLGGSYLTVKQKEIAKRLGAGGPT